MSRVKYPVNNFGSGNTKLRAVVTTAAAALIGTLVGGASVLGIVTTVTQPPAHDIKTDAQPGGTAAPAPSAQAATPPSQAAPVVAERQSAPPAEGFRAVWPDALSARANHGSERSEPAPAPATPAPQQALPPASDRSALNQSEQYGTGREPYAANSGAVTARDSLPNQISPNTAPAKKRVVATPPGQFADRTVDETSAGNASVGKTRTDPKTSQAPQARQQQRSPDTTDRSGGDQAASVYPPQRRVIILPGPDQAANEDRGHWGGGGGGLFDFFGQNHSDGDHWSQDHWNNDWHGSHDWHD
jgi:hypothetical protein